VRRLFNRNTHFKVTLEQPEPSIQTYALYCQHKKRFNRQVFDSYDLYIKSFFGPPYFTFNRVLTVRDGGKTVALTHLDVTANAMSAIYCYFDESYSRFSPGTYSVYKEIELCKQLGIRWLYLGFYVPGNRHMAYKTRFKPSQLMNKDYKWIDYIDSAGNVVNPLPV
jgi:arginine-tRNA-protein transferase